jgi:hypothetical protein
MLKKEISGYYESLFGLELILQVEWSHWADSLVVVLKQCYEVCSFSSFSSHAGMSCDWWSILVYYIIAPQSIGNINFYLAEIIVFAYPLVHIWI